MEQKIKYTIRVGNRTVYAQFYEAKTLRWVENEVFKLCADFDLFLTTGEKYDLVIIGNDKYLSDFICSRLHNLRGISAANTITEYDDNRVYRTGERQLDTRIDCSIMRG